MAEALNFDDLTRQEAPVSVRGKRYVLTEASGDAAVRYRNAKAAAGRYSADGKFISVEALASTEPLLVSRCLYHAAADGSLRLTPDGDPDQRFLVAEATIRAWPSKVQKGCFEWVIAASGLGDAAETRDVLEKRLADAQARLAELDAEKNGAPASTATSA